MANLKISQVERTTDMDTDAYVLVVQNGKNYRMSIKDAIAANVDINTEDLDNYYTKSETTTLVNNAVEEVHSCLNDYTTKEETNVYITNAIEEVHNCLNDYATKEETTTLVEEAIQDLEITTETGTTTTITEVVTTVEVQTEQIVELAKTTETQAEQIIQLEQTIQNINTNVATPDDAESTFVDIFEF